MRIVDRHMGVPLCYCFSIIYSIIRFFKIKQENRIDKILFIQLSEMGSAVSLAPSIMYLKKNHPRTEIYYLMFKEILEIVEVMGIVDCKNLFTIRSRSFLLMCTDTLKVVWQLRRKRIDVIIDIELFSRFSALLSYLIGANDVIGFNKFHMEGLYKGNFQTKKVLYNHTRHIAFNFLACVHAIDASRDEVPLLKRNFELKNFYPPPISSDRESKNKMIERIKLINPDFDEDKKIIILNPNASKLLPLRRWPLKNYSELAKNLIRYTSGYVIITGTKEEQKDTKIIYDEVGDKRCIDFAGKTTLKELIDLYNIADVLVSNDSGPPNFAAHTSIKIIVLFGPETPLCYTPLSKNVTVMYADFMCSPCVSAYNHRKSACLDNKCMQAITVENVYKEVIKAIS